MADKTDVKEDEVDVEILEGCLIAPFERMTLSSWEKTVRDLPTELRLEVWRSSSYEDGCVFVPRPVWLLAKNLSELRALRH